MLFLMVTILSLLSPLWSCISLELELGLLSLELAQGLLVVLVEMARTGDPWVLLDAKSMLLPKYLLLKKYMNLN